MKIWYPLLTNWKSHDGLTLYAQGCEPAQPMEGKCTLVLWEGGFHELHNESIKVEVFRTMTDWMNAL